VPRRLKGSEAIARGRKKAEDVAMEAGKAASNGAVPLQYNHYKVPLMENLVRRAIRDA
jgi:xanthine dehydrogenase YagS FAD-binding subunit